MLHDLNADRETPIVIRQVKYLNKIVEQDHSATKRVVRPMLGFKAFRCARILLAGIELMHMIAKGQMKCPDGSNPSAAEPFYSLAGGGLPGWGVRATIAFFIVPPDGPLSARIGGFIPLPGAICRHNTFPQPR
ncbi:transposase [Cupriavidus basilensis OR16]|uniref:Transposase n=1 Tax=Cupriavidus basilensis OR16 TaxID=1127483 RepID=H1SCZ0_9BURK|nr:transposase [Cupriavidus basilensis OR16]